ncbi:MAG: hypothetical protein NTX79_04965 [Candidatus Micrarchaeota archaeon]|nr:hypothetical protein [Candidatus Micrarchaeota archaeon]
MATFNRTDNHAEVGFFLLKKNEKPPIREDSAVIGRVQMPSKIKPARSQIPFVDNPIIGWVDFSLNGNEASTTSILPRVQRADDLDLTPDQLATMRLVFLKKSIETLKEYRCIKKVGTSAFPSDFTASQIRGIGLDTGLLYPVRQFTKALSEGIKKGLDALSGG